MIWSRLHSRKILQQLGGLVCWNPGVDSRLVWHVANTVREQLRQRSRIEGYGRHGEVSGEDRMGAMKSCLSPMSAAFRFYLRQLIQGVLDEKAISDFARVGRAVRHGPTL